MSFISDIRSRILVLDGAMGTMIQRHGYYVENNEALNLTNPELITSIHREYIAAGADIISTNSFGANSLTQKRYGREDDAEQMAFQAARIAREAADNSCRKVYVAGSVGPTGYSLSIPSDGADPAFRKVDFATLYTSYLGQIKSLVQGGADIILIETCFDALNAKAAILALSELDYGIPVIISASISDNSFRLLTGQTLEAFYHSVKHCPNLAAFGINCSLGSRMMASVAREIASFSELPLIFYPNAGMPDENGAYNESPEFFSREIGNLAEEGILNIAGGCCGTGPEHIKALKETLALFKPGTPQTSGNGLTVCGLETVHIDKSHNFTNIGERTNVAGSKKFAKLIASDNYFEAIKVARDQVLGGATVIDINMDDPMVDSSEKMRNFLRFISSEPEISKCAIMIDSSNWETIIEGLRNAPGKCIVNSISLRDGEEAFKKNALEIRRYGASMVIMAFDEQGQAVTYERKIEICKRSYDILISIGIKPEDIIFDCNVLTVGTGIPEHAEFAKAYIEAVAYIKHNLPGALTSGGISNLSFAFRGNNTVREAMHSVFLYHAIKAGLDMAIVNPQMLVMYDSIEPELRKCVEDVILNTDSLSCERLSGMAARIAESVGLKEEQKKETSITDKSPEDALSDGIVNGDTTYLDRNIQELLKKDIPPISIVEGPLMNGMETVGRLFESGKMFLPQVVRSAQVMHEAVAYLKPYMEKADSVLNKPKFLIATVQGDVHDIGKNITSIVLQCSGFEVIDLGVMVPVARILEEAEICKADIIGVSGLITPSLAKMKELCDEMRRRNMTTPLFVGGAATSQLHTAVKLHPCYEHVYYGSNASDTAVSAKKCIASYADFKIESDNKRNSLLELYKKAQTEKSNNKVQVSDEIVTDFAIEGVPLSRMEPSSLSELFDWKLFNLVCGDIGYKESFQRQIEKILEGGEIEVKICSRYFDATRKDDTIEFFCDGRKMVIPMLRDADTGYSPADYFSENHKSPIGIFAVSVIDNGIFDKNDIIRHAIKSMLAEAGTEFLRRNALMQLKERGIQKFRLIAPGIGYPCCPDHGLKRDILSILPSDLGIELTETCAMIPEHSTCGFIILHPDAEYRDIRHISDESMMRYVKLREYDESQKNLFLSFLEKQI